MQTTIFTFGLLAGMASASVYKPNHALHMRHPKFHHMKRQNDTASSSNAASSASSDVSSIPSFTLSATRTGLPLNTGIASAILGAASPTTSSSSSLGGFANSTTSAATLPSSTIVDDGAITTITVDQTITETSISCAPTVIRCPAASETAALSTIPHRVVTVTNTVPITVVTCPVAEASSISKSIVEVVATGGIPAPVPVPSQALTTSALGVPGVGNGAAKPPAQTTVVDQVITDVVTLTRGGQETTSTLTRTTKLTMTLTITRVGEPTGGASNGNGNGAGCTTGQCNNQPQPNPGNAGNSGNPGNGSNNPGAGLPGTCSAAGAQCQCPGAQTVTVKETVTSTLAAQTIQQTVFVTMTGAPAPSATQGNSPNGQNGNGQNGKGNGKGKGKGNSTSTLAPFPTGVNNGTNVGGAIVPSGTATLPSNEEECTDAGEVTVTTTASPTARRL